MLLAIGVFVYSVAFGSVAQDYFAGYIGSVNSQVEKVCHRLKEIKELKHGYNAIGFSQGGQFLRAVAQRCNHERPKMKVLITMGGQHQGVMGYPGCNVMHDMSIWCKIVQRAIQSSIASNIVQAQYYKDPFHYEAYLEQSQFLKDVNNDGKTKNKLYAQNLASLEKFVMVRFDEDTMVIPRDSSWFSYYNGTHLLPLRDQDTYKEDWIGLKTLDEANRLVFIHSPTKHMRFTMDWLLKEITDPYLAHKKHHSTV